MSRTTPKEARVLHLLRAILRECTYLPDYQARNYMWNQCLHRFKARKDDDRDIAFSTGKQSAEVRGRRAVSKAKDALKDLQRANAGHKRHLTKVLEMTYGRTGKRRHRLLEAFTKSSTATGSEFDWAGLSPELSDLLSSQWSRPGTSPIRPAVKKVSLDIPAKNSWGRPMPQKRVNNKKRRIYGEVMDRVLPPVPYDEQKRLRHLALGQGDAAKLSRPRRRGSRNERGMRTHTTQTKMISRPHALTSRYMRRRYTNIVMNTPALKATEAKLKNEAQWKIEWTDIRKECEVAMKTGKQLPLAMFEGVDAKGKLLSKSIPQTTPPTQ
ncbi:uncharacterized protein KY384_008768 [Bacidia gigantensis]|uniref:uncharacterized protein n=1 Tax=Bacidia gigantensis TaxID=2732470 RepID=UPI001D0545FB|nr:uncharacterized protein KY384_008768 [Bacidia gigantensis]KAG8526567.1 hypothetical protein KY384_008768 [Bacidia gigantensis]